MSTSRNRQWAKSLVLLLLLMALSVVWGCRAFQPEAVVVNKAPNTFIIGAPMEHGGGYYHFHVFWYGTDEDGEVEQFVWAVTDTTVQDDETTDDEEDLRFNPALDASHLEIAEYTSRRDSVFDFRINQGSNISYDITLHMVAKDDYGDFDRSPARLHFFTNALGTPEIEFFRREGDNEYPISSAGPDTVGFGQPYTLTWAGGTPNIRGYDPMLLAEIDTVYPYDDGLFGYKWQLLGALGNNCVPTLEDCWHPRLFNEATGDSYSYFADLTQLNFENDNSGTSPFEKRLPAGIVNLRVNSVDVAGVEVPTYLQSFRLQVNYDPITVVLDSVADLSHGDSEIYPYYIRLNDPTETHIPFSSGTRVPDNSYVIVKALFKDDPRDIPLGSGGQPLGVEGFVEGVRSNLGGGVFTFATEASDLDTMPTWGPDAEGWSADTLGFLVGPRAHFAFRMLGVDEHGQRDGTPDSVTFDVGYEPCVQCVEVMRTGMPSDFPDMDLECMHSACLEDTTQLFLSTSPPPGDNRYLTLDGSDTWFLAVHKLNGSSKTISASEQDAYADEYFLVGANKYLFRIFLHGQDHPDERWPGPDFSKRIMAWRYQVNNRCDPFNSIRDGGGVDNILQPTYGAGEAFDQSSCNDIPLCISEDDGLWSLRSYITVPTFMMFTGEGYRDYLVNSGGYSLEEADMIFIAACRQLGGGSIEVVARDQTSCGFYPNRPARYNVFRKVRPPENAAGVEWRTCLYRNLGEGNIKATISMDLGAMESNNGDPVTKYFHVTMQSIAGDFDGYEDCGAPGLK